MDSSFFHTEEFGEIPMGLPPTEASNTSGVGKIGDFRLV